jgi:hypothetical protein
VNLSRRRVLHRAALVIALLLPTSAMVMSPGAASASTCNTTAVGSWANNCTVTEGADSEYVVAIQAIVVNYDAGHDLSCYNPDAGYDGDFGPATLQDVECFQQHNGLAADGSVGPKTWAALALQQIWAYDKGGWAYYSCTYCVTPYWFVQWINSSKWYVWSNSKQGYVVMNTGPPHPN